MPCDLSQLSQLVSGESGFEPVSPVFFLPQFTTLSPCGTFRFILYYHSLLLFPRLGLTPLQCICSMIIFSVGVSERRISGRANGIPLVRLHVPVAFLPFQKVCKEGCLGR